MSELGFYLLGTLLRGAVIFGAVLLLEKAFRFRLTGAKFRYWWAGMILLMLLPLNPGRVQLPREIVLPAVTPAVSAPADAVPAPKPKKPRQPQRLETGTLASLFACLLLTGGVAVLAARLRREWKFRKFLAVRPPLHVPEIAQLLPENVKLLEGENPLCFGFLRPGILLPAGLEEQETAMLLRHELFHLKHHDQLWNGILYFTGAFLWFNPFFQFCAARLLRCREMACDAHVVREFNRSDKLRYAQLICSFATGSAVPAAPCLGRSAEEVKQRIEEIAMKHKESAFRRILLPLLLTAVAATALLVPGCAKKTVSPGSDRYVRTELTVDSLPNPEDPEKPYLRFSLRMLDGEEIISAPRVISLEEQLATCSLSKTYEPPELFKKELPSQNFGLLTTQGAGIWFFMEGKLTGDGRVEVKLAQWLRTFRTLEKPTFDRYSELRATLNLGQTIVIPMGSEFQEIGELEAGKQQQNGKQ